MNAKRKIEVFTAGCPVCDAAIEMVNRIACPSCEVQVLDMRDSKNAARARALGINRMPAVAINGVLATCCTGWAVNESDLRQLGLGRR